MPVPPNSMKPSNISKTSKNDCPKSSANWQTASQRSPPSNEMERVPPLPQNPIRGGREIIHRNRSGQFSRRALLHFRAITSSHQNAFFHAGVPTAFQIDQFVSDHITLRKIDPKLIARIEKKLR